MNKPNYKNLESVTDFEKRYGTQKSYGEAIIYEQKVKDKKDKKYNKKLKYLKYNKKCKLNQNE